MKNPFKRSRPEPPVTVLTPSYSYSFSSNQITGGDAYEANDRLFNAPYQYSYHDGDKFFNGFGETQLQITDYWTLRHRSAQLFNENLYARGLIRRLITNEINTGLSLESMPDESILGLPDDSLADWSEDVENRFAVWSKSAQIVDFKRQQNFGALQRACRMESLVTGDCLVVLRQNRTTGLPTIELLSGNRVQTPLGSSDQQFRGGLRIRHGVEIDDAGRHLAYHVVDELGESTRIAAFGGRSGRRVAWLVYGTEKRLDDIRGQPILSLVMQSLKEIDRYRDSTQRKAVINSMLAMFIKKDEDKPGTLPITNGAVRRDQITLNSVGSQTGEQTRRYDVASMIPGLIPQELQTGETPMGFGNEGIDEKFGEFEAAIIQAIAWAMEIAPEVLTLAFSSNYSASQAAVNETKLYLNRIRTEFGDQFCQPIYTEWMISSVLKARIEAAGFLDAWRDVTRYDEFGSWLSSDWSGAIKLSSDIKKQAEGYQLLVEQGWITNERASRELTGTKFRKNMKRLRREQELKDEVFRPETPAPGGNVVPLRGASNG